MNEFDILFMNNPNLVLVKGIHSNKSSILVVNCVSDAKCYVLKALPKKNIIYESGKREKYLHSSFAHPHIIQHISLNFLARKKESLFENIISMEYAPYGDFFNLIFDGVFADEKLVRTYFHQLIDGLEYLHSQKVAHLDLKLENLLLGEDFLLKIADFDLAQEVNKKNLPAISSGGTANYRPPEILSGTCVDYISADIYSAGICLYTLMTGSFPFMEDTDGENISLYRYGTFLRDNEKFWRENEELMDGKVRFSQDFKELLNKMLWKNPSERISLKEIKRSRWYSEPIYSYEELKKKMAKILRY